MPKPYSLDLRERVVGFVEAGQSRHAAAAHFKVSVSFVVNLMKAVRMRGSFVPKPSGGRGHAKLEPHRSFLLAQVVEKADITMPELAAELAAATGEKADPALAPSRRLPFQKKLCEPASTIGPTSNRRARNGSAFANRRCGLSRIGWSSSTRLEPPPR
jgi:transposase